MDTLSGTTVDLVRDSSAVSSLTERQVIVPSSLERLGDFAFSSSSTCFVCFSSLLALGDLVFPTVAAPHTVILRLN
jgi:hypothetical protein